MSPPRGFAARLGLAMALLIALVCALQSWLLGQRSLEHVRGYLADRGRATVSRLAHDVALRLGGAGTEPLGMLADQSRTESGVEYVRLLDPDGLLLAAIGKPPVAAPPVEAVPAVTGPIPIGEDLWEFRAPIVAVAGRQRRDAAAISSAAPRLGTAVIGVSLEPLHALRRRTIRTATIFTVLFTAVAAAAALLLAQAITRPVQALSAAAARVARGDYDARVAVRRRDEVGALAAAFNAMAESIGRGRMALEEKVRELSQANHLKSEFLATVSHELRTPLNVIIGYADMLADGGLGPLTGDQASMVVSIRRYSKLQLDLITSVLDFARLSSGQVSFRIERFSVATLLTEIQGLFSARLRSPAVALTVAVDADVPDLETDRVKLQEIVHNLLDNAVKFTEEGSIAVRARPGTAPGWVTIEVADTGVGIGDAELRSIFDAFRQVGESSTRATGGVGLGLSIVKQLVEALGGTVAVASGLGSGSVFRVDLPCVLRPAEEPLAAGEALDDTARNIATIPELRRPEGTGRRRRASHA